MREGGTLYYMLSDHLGSTSLTLNASGQLLSELRYKAWGEVRYRAGVTLTEYTFTGQYSNVNDFGLFFYNARWYDPALARFTRADTLVPAGVQGYDRYAYTSNNPVRYTDPSGHWAWEGEGGCADEADCTPRPVPITVYIGGLRPANAPGVQGDADNPQITNPRGSGAVGLVEALNFVNSVASFFAPTSPTPVDVFLTYTLNPNESIGNMLVTINNHDGGSSVSLEKIAIELEDRMTLPHASVREGTYVLDANWIVVDPGEVESAVICSSCIADNTLNFFMPIPQNTQVTITAVVGAFFNVGNQGTSYAAFNFSYTIPARR